MASSHLIPLAFVHPVSVPHCLRACPLSCLSVAFPFPTDLPLHLLSGDGFAHGCGAGAQGFCMLAVSRPAQDVVCMPAVACVAWDALFRWRLRG